MQPEGRARALLLVVGSEAGFGEDRGGQTGEPPVQGIPPRHRVTGGSLGETFGGASRRAMVGTVGHLDKVATALLRATTP